jgi:hypothetical protein
MVRCGTVGLMSSRIIRKVLNNTMHKHIAEMVASALTSGKYAQGKKALVQDNPAKKGEHLWCVTGIICNLAVAAGVASRVRVDGKLGYRDKNGIFTHRIVPPGVLEFAGMRNTSIRNGVKIRARRYPVVTTLEGLNDIGANGTPWTFEKLAKLITKRYADIGA